MDNQSLGLANALGLEVICKRIQPTTPWKYLPPQLWLQPIRFLGSGSDPIEPPWPEIIIGTGRKTVAVALAIKRASGGKSLNIRIQNPRTAHGEFDVIITPKHDRLDLPNVVQTQGGLHTLTPERIRQAGERFTAQFAHLPRPLVAVLVGGSNKCYRITPTIVRKLSEQLVAMSRETGAGILVTPSRRTGAEAEAILRTALANVPSYVWNGTGDNPYLAFLALADVIVCTADSINMISEACMTGKPVYVVELEGGSEKFRYFHDSMRQGGYTRPFNGKLETWVYEPLDDVSLVAAEVKKRLSCG